MRFLTWNISHGGSSRIAAICAEIAEHQPDILALTEFQTYNEAVLRTQLGHLGYGFVVTSKPVPKQNGLLLASRLPVEMVAPPEWDMDGERWLAVHVADMDLDVLVVHIPGSDDNKFRDGFGISGLKRKELMWDRVVTYALDRVDKRTIIMGDFNTGFRIDTEGAAFKLSAYMDTLVENGFADCWRMLHPNVRDFTWFSKRKDKETGITHDLNGFRLDYIFASPVLGDSIAGAQIVQRARLAGTSDHAVVIADIDVVEFPSVETTPQTESLTLVEDPVVVRAPRAASMAPTAGSVLVRTGKFRERFDIAPGSLPEMINGLNGDAAQQAFRPTHITADWNRDVLVEVRVWGPQLLQSGLLGSRQLDHLWKRRIADGGNQVFRSTRSSGGTTQGVRRLAWPRTSASIKKIGLMA